MAISIKVPCALCGKSCPENDRLNTAAGGLVHFQCAARLALAHCRGGRVRVTAGRRGRWAGTAGKVGHA